MDSSVQSSLRDAAIARFSPSSQFLLSQLHSTSNLSSSSSLLLPCSFDTAAIAAGIPLRPNEFLYSPTLTYHAAELDFGTTLSKIRHVLPPLALAPTLPSQPSPHTRRHTGTRDAWTGAGGQGRCTSIKRAAVIEEGEQQHEGCPRAAEGEVNEE